MVRRESPAPETRPVYVDCCERSSHRTAASGGRARSLGPRKRVIGWALAKASATTATDSPRPQVGAARTGPRLDSLSALGSRRKPSQLAGGRDRHRQAVPRRQVAGDLDHAVRCVEAGRLGDPPARLDAERLRTTPGLTAIPGVGPVLARFLIAGLVYWANRQRKQPPRSALRSPISP